MRPVRDAVQSKFFAVDAETSHVFDAIETAHFSLIYFPSV